MAGKGSRQRPTDTTKYQSNWERIFSGSKGSEKLSDTSGTVMVPEPGMSTACLEYRGGPNAHIEGAEVHRSTADE
jgi:hypothetical protein